MALLPTQKLALDGCEVRCRGRQTRAHPLHAFEIAREAIRHRHGHRTQKAHDLQVAVVEQIPARRAVHRFQHTFVSVTFSFGRESRNRKEDAHQLAPLAQFRSEEHTSELQSLMRISYAVSCLKKKTHSNNLKHTRIYH